MCFKERQDRFIEHMNRSHRQLAGIVPSPGMTVLAVQHDSQIHLVPLEYTDDEGIARHQFPNVVNFDLAFAKLRTEALEQANLFIIELHRLLPMGFLEAQQAAELGKQVVTLSYATQIARTDVDALQTRLCADHSGYWVGERVIEDGLFNLGSDPVGMCPLQPGSLSSKPSADQLAGFAYVIEIFGEL